jgi:hypothetical protein
MLGQRERGRAVTFEVVALVALVLVRLTGELIVVLILVAIGALIKFGDPEDRLLPLGSVALIALHFRVALDEGIVRLRVSLDVE